jgi:hypothetical protein
MAMSSKGRRRLTWTLMTGAVVLVGMVSAVVFVRLPVSAALWLVDTHPGFFAQTYQEWSVGKPLHTRLTVRALAYKLSRDWVTQTARSVRRENPAGMYGTVVAARSVFKGVYLNQRDVRHPPIDLATYARLVYGMAWCDGQNHLFALLLGEFFDDVHTFALWNRDTKLNVHVAVTIRRNGIVHYADAWTKVPMFVMDEDRTHTDANIPVWSTIAEEFKPEGAYDADYSPDTVMGFFQDGEKRIAIRGLVVPIGIIDPWPEPATPPVVGGGSHPFYDGKEGLRHYLRARVYQLYGYNAAARTEFAKVLTDAPAEPFIRKAAEIFYERL